LTEKRRELEWPEAARVIGCGEGCPLPTGVESGKGGNFLNVRVKNAGFYYTFMHFITKNYSTGTCACGRQKLGLDWKGLNPPAWG